MSTTPYIVFEYDKITMDIFYTHGKLNLLHVIKSNRMAHEFTSHLNYSKYHFMRYTKIVNRFKDFVILSQITFLPLLPGHALSFPLILQVE